MRKLYEIFKILKDQKRIVSAETIRGNTVITFDFQEKTSLLQSTFLFGTPF